MALKTQGSKLYLIDPASGDVVTVGCVNSISGIEATRDQLESTCLEDSARRYEAGLATPGQAQFAIHFDPADASHKRIYDLWQSGDKFEMALGYSDGTVAPDADTAGMFDLPEERSWCVMHDCFIANVPQDLALNALVNAQVSVQLSGFPVLVEKSAT